MDNKSYLQEHSKILNICNFEVLNEMFHEIKKNFDGDSNIFTCGNGGSAHTSEHAVTDWSKMSYILNNKKLHVYSLNSNGGILTAFANDIEYKDIFSEQLKIYGKKNDILLAISGSGNSKNILNAADLARSVGMKVFSFVGFDGGKLIKKSDSYFLVPSFDMQICEDIHLMAMHMIMKKLCNIKTILCEK